MLGLTDISSKFAVFRYISNHKSCAHNHMVCPWGLEDTLVMNGRETAAVVRGWAQECTQARESRRPPAANCSLCM
jgi:hypothetical protein